MKSQSAIGERDAAGRPRESVDILRGDPDQVAAVADTLAFEHKYTSGVIAWAPDDCPSDAQIAAVLDTFDQTAWTALEADRYAWAAVLHRERSGGGTYMCSPPGATWRRAGASIAPTERFFPLAEELIQEGRHVVGQRPFTSSTSAATRRSRFLACQLKSWRAKGCIHAEVLPDPTAPKIATPV